MSLTSDQGGAAEAPASSLVSPAKQLRFKAFLALLLLAPMPSLAILSAAVWHLGAIGQAFFTFGKFWIFAFPAAWMLLVDRAKPSWSPPRRGGFIPAIILGLAIAACIVLAIILARPWINLPDLKRLVGRFHLLNKTIFILAAAYWCLINSVLEEYVWRWFVYSKLVELLAPPPAPPPEIRPGRPPLVATNDARTIAAERWACLLCALLFTAHHAIALGVYVVWPLALLGCLGVFVGGLIWSWLYRRYGSIWPGYVSHLCADLAIFVTVWFLIFS